MGEGGKEGGSEGGVEEMGRTRDVSLESSSHSLTYGKKR